MDDYHTQDLNIINAHQSLLRSLGFSTGYMTRVVFASIGQDRYATHITRGTWTQEAGGRWCRTHDSAGRRVRYDVTQSVDTARDLETLAE